MRLIVTCEACRHMDQPFSSKMVDLKAHHLFLKRSIRLGLCLCFFLCNILLELGLSLQAERAELRLESL